MDGLTIIIPYRNERVALNRLLDTLPTDVSVLVVDDASEVAPDSNIVAGALNVQILRLKKRGYFSGAVNAGMAACAGDGLVLNQDIWFDKGHAWQAQVEELRKTYATFGDGVMQHPAWPKGYVHGVFQFLRRDAWQKVGPFDARNWPLWGATAEWQLRACRAGFKAHPMGNLDWFSHERKGNFGRSIAATLEEQPQDKSLLIRTPPLVSVVCPTCKQAHYMDDLLGSLVGGPTCLGPMGQTFQGFEVVVVDDCDDKATAERMQHWADPWKGVRYLKTAQNSGTAIAMNVGISQAYGRYIMALDGDDMLEPNALQVLVDTIQAKPHSLVYPDQWIVTKGQRAKEWKLRDYDFEKLLVRNMVPAGVLFERSAWQEIGGYPALMRWGRQDWAFAVAMGQAGYCGVHVQEPLYLYRREGQNRTLRNSTAEWRQIFVGQMHEAFPDLYAGVRPMGCCGNRKSTPQPKRVGAGGTQPMMMRTGESGMTLVEYTGANDGRVYWFGAVTRTRYSFSAKRKVGYVDSRDLPALLEAMEGKRKVFRLYRAPKSPVLTPALKQLETVQVDEAAIPEAEAVKVPPHDVVAQENRDRIYNEGMATIEARIRARNVDHEAAGILGFAMAADAAKDAEEAEKPRRRRASRKLKRG